VLWDTNMGMLTQFKTPSGLSYLGMGTITFHGAMMILESFAGFMFD
jgi:hypothetical protein